MISPLHNSKPPLRFLSYIVFFWTGFCLFWGASVQAQTSIRGQVRDDDTGKPLPGATIEIEGTERGVVAGGEGSFVLPVEELPVTFEVRHVGFDPQKRTIFVAGKRSVEVRLTPVVYEMEGVVVDYQDPAVRAMREVIRRKRDWWLHLESHTAEVYARQTLFSDMDVVGIRETVARVYSDWRQGAREVVRAKRYTSNVPGALRDFSASDYAANLYADEVEILDNQVMGVTHPKALRNYYFQLIEEMERDGGGYFSIAVTPREELAYGFAGRLLVREEDFALVEAKLKIVPPVQSSVFPTEMGIGISYEQTFRRFEPGAYLPVMLRYEMEGRFGRSAMGEEVKRQGGVTTSPSQPQGGMTFDQLGEHLGRFGTPRARLRGLTLWSGQRAGVELPELFFIDGKKLQVEKRAEQKIELLEPYWDEVPHSLREESAYSQLRRRPRPLGTARALFELYGKRVVQREKPPHEIDPLAEGSAVRDEVVTAVIEGATGVGVGGLAEKRFVPEFGYELWFNRVDGGHAGLKGKSVLSERLALYTKGGYNAGSEKKFYGVGFRHAWGREKSGFAGLNYQIGTRSRYPSESYSLAFNSLPMLLSLDDYFDYYWSRRFAAEVGYRFEEAKSTVRVSFNREEHRSLAKSTDFDIACGYQNKNGRIYELLCEDRDEPQRENPAVEEGQLRSFGLIFNWGGGYRPFGRRAQKRVELELEHSGDWLGSDFDFTRYRLAFDWHTDALVRRLGIGETVHLHGLVGTASGELPIQRYGSLDASIWIFQPFGTFRSLDGRPYEGEKYAGLFWEVDLGSGLFKKMRLNGLARRGMELAVHGASGRTWVGRELRDGFWYAPIGREGRDWLWYALRVPDRFHHEVGLSFVLRSLRIELTRRLDRGRWAIGFSLAR